MANELVPQRGVTTREDFSGTEVQQSPETAMAAVTAKERALVEALFLMSERHPRNWLNVRANILDHCKRPRFAEVARYSRPAGKELVNGEWVEKKAEGFTTRFTEILAQEMGNVKLSASVTYEDELIRIVRFSVLDLQKNLLKEREVSIAKAVERRGFKNKQGGWDPPKGRDVISQRLNSAGEPTFLVKATAEELRAKTNAEESKSQRDFITRMCPRDILEDCEDRVKATLADETQRDPQAFLKKILDRFAELNVMPSDLTAYMGRDPKSWNKKDIDELVGLGAAIRDGHTTFDEAMRIRNAAPEEGEEETKEQHDARLQRQMRQQEKRESVAEEKIAKLRGQKADSPATQGQPSRAADEPKPAPVAEPAEAQGKHEPPPPNQITPTTQPGSGERGTAVHGQGPGETSAAVGGTTVKSPSAPTPGPKNQAPWQDDQAKEAPVQLRITHEQAEQFRVLSLNLGRREFHRLLGIEGFTAIEEIPTPEVANGILKVLKAADQEDRALFNQAPDEAGPSEGAYRDEPPKRGRGGFGGRRG